MKLNVEIEVNDSQLGEVLVADDPEGFPLTAFAVEVQMAIFHELGWTYEIGERLYKQANKATNDDNAYSRWVQLAQEWAQGVLNGKKS